MVLDGDDLYVGGDFRIAGGRLARGVARWDGRHWHPLGAGVEGLVRAMTLFQGELYVGGGFQEAGGEAIAHLTRWDGSRWAAVGWGSMIGSPQWSSMMASCSCLDRFRRRAD
jgi:trimeric autotransporter adhesin